MKTFLDVKMYRWHPHKYTTLGIFCVYDKVFYTAEDTIKIIPAGEYECFLDDTTSTNNKAGLDCVYELAKNPPGRTLIKFAHVGNTHKDVDGCIAIGLGYDIDTPSILYSVKAVIAFYELLDKKIGLNPIKLSIIE